MQLMLAAPIVLMVTFASLANDFLLFKTSIEKQFASTSKILERNLVPALAFLDQPEAKEVLSSLSTEPSIVSARLFDKNGAIFASFTNGQMHGILSFARFGQQKIETASKEKIKSYFDEINDSGSRLMSLLNDLLDLSKLEAGKVVYSMKRDDFSEIVRAANSELQAFAEEKISSSNPSISLRMLTRTLMPKR